MPSRLSRKSLTASMDDVDDVFTGNLDTLERIVNSKARIGKMLEDMSLEIDPPGDSDNG